MGRGRPRVSIGMPVYNGERFIRAALDSILGQTFGGFELIISDNASTDGTEQICRAYAARDDRIRYVRNERNLGAARNFNRTFELSCGEYFKWTAHDDVLAPEYLARCVETLDRAPRSVVLCLPRTLIINADGKVVRHLGFVENSRSVNGWGECRELRFREAVRLGPGGVAQVAFGLMRADILRMTRLMGGYQSADFMFAAEMSLRGQLLQMPEYLFFLRIYGQHLRRRTRPRREEAVWWDTSNGSPPVLPPMWKLLLEHIRAIQRSDLGRLNKACRGLELTGFVASWMRRRWGRVGWRVRSWASLELLVASKCGCWPLRVWALARLVRRSTGWRLDRAFQDAWNMTEADLLTAAAQALVIRSDPLSRKTLSAWLADQREAYRIAAASALGERSAQFSDMVESRPANESSDPVRSVV